MKHRKTWKFEGETSDLNALQQMYGEDGCKESQYLLGKSLIIQSQKESDFLKAESALNWLLKAANLGHKGALITLRTCYRNNCGISSDNKHVIEKCLQRSGKEIEAEIYGHALFISITDSFETEISKSLAAVRLTSILVDKQCNKEKENIVDVSDNETINEQDLINCVNDLFSFKNPKLTLSCSFGKQDNKLNRLTDNVCEASNDCLKITPTFVITEAVQCLSKSIFYPVNCESEFNFSLVRKVIIISAFHISTLIINQEKQFLNYRNWIDLVTSFGKSFGDEEIGKFYDGFKKAALFVIFFLSFAIYTKFFTSDEKDSSFTCLSMLILAMNLHTFFRHLTFHKTFVTITLMSSLANAILEPHLTRKGIILFETIDLMIFLLYIIKKRKQFNRIHLYRVIFPMFSVKLWFQMSINLLRDANSFKPLLYSIVPTFITAVEIPKLSIIWIMMVLGIQSPSIYEVFTIRTLFNASLLIVIYLVLLKTKWRLIAMFCVILSIACIVFVGPNNEFKEMNTHEITNWKTVYELCYKDNEMKSIEKCLNLRENVIISVDAVVNSRRFIKHRNRMKQLIDNIGWSLMRRKLICFLGVNEQRESELLNKCSLRNWDINEFEVLVTTISTNTVLRLECAQNIRELITEMEEGNVYNLLFKLTDIPTINGRLLNAARPTLS